MSTGEERALDIHRKAIVVDSSSLPIPEGYFARMKQGGVTASNVTCPREPCELKDAIRRIYALYDWIDKSPDEALFVTSVEDIVRAKKEGKAAIILGPQDPKPIGDELELLTILHRLGVRILQLTYNEKNYVGDGCTERTDCGLSKFGVRLIKEMDRIGVVIDLSHVGKVTSMQAMELTKNPVIFSHSNARALCNHPRNIDDEQIKALAEREGVVGLTAVSPFYDVQGRYHPSVDDLLKHVDYVVNLVGVDHVGFGLDINEYQSTLYGRADEDYGSYAKRYPEIVAGYPSVETLWLKGLQNVKSFPEVTKGLVKKGYSDEEILKLLGGNFLRVFGKVWRE